MNELVFKSDKGVLLLSSDASAFIREIHPEMTGDIYVCHNSIGSYVSNGILTINLFVVLNNIVGVSYNRDLVGALDAINEILPIGCPLFSHALTTGLFHWELSKRRQRVKSCDQKTYIIKDKITGAHKIGKSADLSSRIMALSNGNINLCVVLSIGSDVENELHRKYSHKRIKGEWFSLTTKDISDIQNKYKVKRHE